MALYGVKPAFRRGLGPVVGAMARFHPDTVSGFAVVSAFLAAALLYDGATRPWAYLVAPVFMFLRIAFNALDGLVAERRGLQSPQGEMVNEFSDRINDMVILAGIALSGVVHAGLAGAAAVAVLLVSYLGILPRAAGHDRRYDGPLGKADRMLVLSIAAIVAFVAGRTGWAHVGEVWTAAFSLVLAGSLVTVVVRWGRAWRALAPEDPA